jgi:cytochrome P450
MILAYGIRTPHSQISHMVEINKALQNTTQLLAPGTLPPVDLFPFLFYLPHQLFGNWRDKVADTHKMMNGLYSRYMDYVVERQKKVGAMESFADRLLQQEEKLDWTRHGLNFMAGLMMEAGSDTLSGVINSFLLLMTKFPGAYKKAQEQIDVVVGDDRCPRWEDWQKLPEVNKLLKETMRMRPVAPIAFPHALSEGLLFFVLRQHT